MTDDSSALDSLAALGDPTRRMVFERVAARPATVSDLARGLPVSRPAVSQHLKVLKEAGLVLDTPYGTRRVYRINPKGLTAIRNWLDAHWAGAFGLQRLSFEPTQCGLVAYRLSNEHK